METQSVSYIIAKQLKEKGFNEPCLSYFNNDKQKKFILYSDYWITKKPIQNWNHKNFQHGEEIPSSAPTYPQAVLWLYNKHGIWITFYPDGMATLNPKSGNNKLITLDKAITEALKLI